MPMKSAIDCQIRGKTIENPTREGNEKRSNDLSALDREPSDLAITINAGMKRITSMNRTINTFTPKLSQV